MLAYLSLQELPLLLRQTRWFTSAMGEWRKVAGCSPLSQHLLDKGGANTEARGNLRNRALSLLVSLNDTLA